MPDDNENNLQPERPEPSVLEEEEVIERPKPVEEEKREGVSETKEESGLISRPKPDVSEYAENLPKKDDDKS